MALFITLNFVRRAWFLTVANHRGTARRAVYELLSNTNLLMCTTLNEQQPLTFGDVYDRVRDLTTPVTLTLTLVLTTRCLVQFICCERVLTMCKKYTLGVLFSDTRADTTPKAWGG